MSQIKISPVVVQLLEREKRKTKEFLEVTIPKKVVSEEETKIRSQRETF
jgi:hypothetical protein